jgi:hypothetical protein
MSNNTLTPTEIATARSKLAGTDKVEQASKLTQIGLGAAAGAAISVPLAHAAGAATLLGSSALGSALGGVFVAATPVGWVIGSGMAVSALAYGLGKLIADGAKNSERRKQLDTRLGELQKSMQRPALSPPKLEQLLCRLTTAVDRGLLTRDESEQMAQFVNRQTVSVDVAMSRVNDLLRTSQVERPIDEPPQGHSMEREHNMTLDECPELMIHALLEKLYSLRGAASYLDNKAISEKLELVTRKLTLAEVLANQAVIAVAGSQGAGKTTLVKTLYDLDDTWLKGNEGRGERSPLLIVESAEVDSSVGRIMVQVVETADDQSRYVQREIEVSPEDFRRALQGAFPGQLLPKLVVPSRYFDGYGCGFLLLPGYEKRTHYNEVWQSLMRQSLVGADMCVIVTDETRLANSDQDEILRAFRGDLDGSIPIVVISKTEGQSSEKLSSLQASAAQTFEIPAELAKARVICVGTQPESIDVWRDQFAQAIRELPQVQHSFRARQLAIVRDTLTADLSEVLESIDMSARDVSLTNAAFGGPVQDILKAFDAGRSDVRKDYVHELKKALDEYAGASIERALGALHKHEEGALNTVKHSWRWLNTTSGERESILPKYAVDAWQQPWIFDESLTQNFSHVHQELLARLSMDKLGAPKSVRQYRPQQMSTEQELGYFETGHKAATWKRPSKRQVQDLSLLFTHDKDGIIQTSSHMMDAVRLLPAVAMEYVRIVSVYPNLIGVDRQHPIFCVFSDSEDEAQSSISVDTKLGQQGMLILAVIGSALGVSSAAEFIQALDEDSDVNSLVGGSATVVSAMQTIGLSVGLASSVAALLGAGVMVMNFAKSVQRSQGQARDSVRRMTAVISDSHYAHFSSEFDHVMDRLRERLEGSLRKRYRQDEQVIQLDRLKKSLADVQMLANELKVALANNPVFAVG